MLSCIIYVILEENMTKLKNYIFELLGTDLIEKEINPIKLKDFPFYVRELYNLKTGLLLNREILFLEQKSKENLTTDNYQKQIALIENSFNLPVVLVLQNLEAYNRKRLIEKRIAFIIPGKQMFIPHFLIDLRELRNTKENNKEVLQPAAQCILLYQLLKENISEMNFKEIAAKINYTQMTVTRAAKDLADKELCQIEGTNQRKILFVEEGKMLWQKALPYLLNPVKRRIFTNDYIDENLIFKAGFTALSELTNIADDSADCFAISKTDYMYLRKHNKINITNKFEGRIWLEIWKYAPALFANHNIVDPLSLSLSFKDSKDERVEMEIEKMVDRLW